MNAGDIWGKGLPLGHKISRTKEGVKRAEISKTKMLTKPQGSHPWKIGKGSPAGRVPSAKLSKPQVSRTCPTVRKPYGRAGFLVQFTLFRQGYWPSQLLPSPSFPLPLFLLAGCSLTEGPLLCVVGNGAIPSVFQLKKEAVSVTFYSEPQHGGWQRGRREWGGWFLLVGPFFPSRDAKGRRPVTGHGSQYPHIHAAGMQ